VTPSLESLRNRWFVACASARLRRRPLGCVVLGVPLALFRSNGKPVALVDRCPHRNLPLSQGRIEDGMLECVYHGWTFDAAGACVRIPGLKEGAPRPVYRAENVALAERDGFVWVWLGSGVAPPPPVRRHPALEDGAFDSFVWSTQAQCALVDALENLLDANHPHFVHAGLVRTQRRRHPVVVSVRRDAQMAEAVYEENREPQSLIGRLFEGRRTTSVGRFFPPSTAQLEYRGTQGPRFLLTAHFTPLDERCVTIHALLSTPRGGLPARLKEFALRAVLAPVLRQDRTILRRQQANIDRFGGSRFHSTRLDVMRPHILHFLGSEGSANGLPIETSLEMEL